MFLSGRFCREDNKAVKNVDINDKMVLALDLVPIQIIHVNIKHYHIYGSSLDGNNMYIVLNWDNLKVSSHTLLIIHDTGKQSITTDHYMEHVHYN